MYLILAWPSLFVGTLQLAVSVRADADPPPSIQDLIQRAGNAEDEQERFRWLSELEQRADLDEQLRGELKQLLPIVNAWANGKDHAVVDHRRAAENGYLCNFISSSKVRPEAEGSVYPVPPADDSPLRPIWAMVRGRMLIWRVIQSGPLLRVRATRDAYYGEGRRLLADAQRAFPENRVLGMYLGQPIPWPTPLEQDPQAPEWANLQREGLEKLADVIHWWIAERQLPDGQFGGGWGDDVEMWRWWTPVQIGFEDPVVNAAQERTSSGIFRQPHLAAGFTSRMTDVEHSNEDTTDTILPMLHLRPQDPVWKARALRPFERMRDCWTGRNERGFLQFKSIYFSVDEVDASPARAFDTVYHCSVIQPSLLYWQRSGDAAMGAVFSDWLRGWVDAAARAENGKPAGVLPSAIRWPDGGIAAPDRPWWEPFSPGHNDALYNWPGAARLMTSTLLLAWHMTGDEQFLAPLRSMAAIRERHRRESRSAVEGSEAWCAAKMDGFLPDALAKYRLLTGDSRYDGLLSEDGSGYVRYRLSGQVEPLEQELRSNAEAFRANWEGYTSEMRWTDRVISFTRNYLDHVPAPAPPGPRPEILYATATGDPGNPLLFPLNAVRWLTPPRAIAALVTDSSTTGLQAELYHFGSVPRTMGAELYLLETGHYGWTLSSRASGEVIDRGQFDTQGGPQRFAFALSPRTLASLRVERHR